MIRCHLPIMCLFRTSQYLRGEWDYAAAIFTFP
jgi:hypothetical protein